MPYLGNQHIVGDSVHNFKVLDDISSYTETFDGSASSVVSTSDETIRVVNHRFVQGQRVTYNNGGGGNIGGLSSGTAYYVTYDSASTIKLATTLANANNNTNINLTSVGSGSAHTLTAAFDGVNKKFRITHDGGTRARFSQASQLRIAINNVIQKANNDHLNFSEGYAIDVRSIIVFQTAPTVNDIFFGDLLGETLGTFDVSDHKIDNHTGDGSTVEFSLSRNVPNVQSLLVTLDGVLQHASDATTSRAYSLIADNIIQFTGAPASGVQIQIRHLGFAGASTGEVSGFYGRTGNVTLGVTDNISIGDISTSRNINATGIVTASSFVGDGSGLIGVASTDNIVTGTAATFNTYPVDINAGMTVAGVSTFQDIDVDGHTNLDNVNVAGVVTFASAVNMGTLTASTGSFSGNVTIGGTLTYEDVTNIDSVGVITAKGADVNGDLDVDGHTNLDNVSIAGVTTFSDDVVVNFGTGNDLQIYHTSSTNRSYIKEVGSGGFYLQAANLNVMNPAGNETMLRAIPDGAVELYHDNIKHFETTNIGCKIYDDDTTAALQFQNSAGLAGLIMGESTNIIGFKDTNPHWLVKCIKDGAVELYHDNAKRLETTSSGVLINGAAWLQNNGTNITANGLGIHASIFHNGDENTGMDFASSNDQINFRTSGTVRATVQNNGLSVVGVMSALNATISGDLDIDGHTNLDNVSIAGVTTFASNVSVGSSITVGTGVTIESNGQATYTGIITATNFVKADGSGFGASELNELSDAKTSSHNVFVGASAGYSLGSANYNTGVGKQSLYTINNGDRNTALGWNALGRVASSTNNVAVGDDAGFLHTGQDLTAVGSQAFKSGTGSGNTVIGHRAFMGSSTGTNNVVVGKDAALGMTSGDENVHIGYQAGGNATSGDKNVSIGHQAHQFRTTQSSGTAVGYRACRGSANGNDGFGYLACGGGHNSSANLSGYYNIALGSWSMTNIQGGLRNTTVGWYAGKDVNNNDDNVFVGAHAGQSCSSGDKNTLVGADAGFSDNVGNVLTSGSNNILLGYRAMPTAASVSNEVTIGDANITKFRIPGINVTLKDNGGTPTQGHVLTVDGNGEAGFAAASGVSVANQADNRLITATGTTDALNGESTLTYNGNRLFAPSISATDNGAGSPLLSLRQDDQNPWAFEIGNDTYGTGTNGLMGYVENAGDMLIRYRGISAYKSLTIEQHDGSSNRAWMTLGNGGNVVLNYQGNTKLTTVSGGVNVTGDLTATGFIDSSSDIKLKTNIKTIDNALDKVLQLRGAEYDRIDRDNQHEIGVIAQEVEKIIPEVVHGDDTKTVSYGNMVAVLIEAIKEQNEVINEMKKEIDELKSS